ncbi:hypothetical protein QAD02_001622 [Eretmocerus hayati]|uniref:Uncharacterized protein n=1 Tax=Eretmocerus hayati TaxID=131215 RepID=A0ACC2NHH3_9HYME|nr:hypothetical protein QAD02_001622 [Eretmocerus hayati]
MPCWTRVMNSLFKNSADPCTTSGNERYFGIIKSSLLNDHLRARADVFVARNCEQVDAQVKLIQADIGEETLQSKYGRSSGTVTDVDVVEQERTLLPRDVKDLSEYDVWGGV